MHRERIGGREPAPHDQPKLVTKNPMTQHKQVAIEWRGRRAEVDEEMAPLILALWRAGISTTLSCQENRPGIAWIAFATPEDARRFLNRVAVYPDAADLREVNGRTSVGNVPFWETL